MATPRNKQPAYKAEGCKVFRVHPNGDVTMACKISGSPGMLAVRLDSGTIKKIGRR
jgi:hypothetical protein